MEEAIPQTDLIKKERVGKVSKKKGLTIISEETKKDDPMVVENDEKKRNFKKK